MKLNKKLFDLLFYSCIGMFFLIPFFNGDWFKHIAGALIIGFVLGMLNQIIRELDKLNKK